MSFSILISVFNVKLNYLKVCQPKLGASVIVFLRICVFSKAFLSLCLINYPSSDIRYKRCIFTFKHFCNSTESQLFYY